MTATQRPTRAAYKAAAPARALRPAPAGARPDGLRLVSPGERTPQARLRRRRLVLAGVATSVCACLFGVAAEHAVLAEQQFRLANLQAQAGTASALNQALQLEVAQLESPGRIVSEARTKLGMVPPAVITYLVPGHPASAKVKGQPATTPTTTPSSANSGNSSSGSGDSSGRASSDATSAP